MKFTKGDTVVSLKKLWFLQAKHAARYAELDFQTSPLTQHAVEPIVNILDKSGYTFSPDGKIKEEYIFSVLTHIMRGHEFHGQITRGHKYELPSAFVDRNRYFFDTPSTADLKTAILTFKLKGLPYPFQPLSQREPISNFLRSFSLLSDTDWTRQNLKDRTSTFIKKEALRCFSNLHAGYKLHLGPEETIKNLEAAWARLAHSSIRWATVVGMAGPDGAETMIILGRAESIQRLEAAADIMEDQAENASFGSMDDMASPDPKQIVVKAEFKDISATKKEVTGKDNKDAAFGSMDG
jgi:glutamyl-tRNA synthetase